jgi:hypothetical protein
MLGGIVAVGADFPDFPDAVTSRVDAPAGAGGGACLAAAIRHVPGDAGLVVWLEGDVPAGDWPAAVTQLASALGDHDAVLYAALVTDAVKQVHGSRIRRGVARDGLCVPVPPLLIRATVARDGLLEHLDHGHDPISALSAGGLTVRTVPLRTPVGG